MEAGWKKILIVSFLLIVTVLCLVNSARRDIIYKSDYNSDLRNRVVGARLIADGKSPYYYKWKKADGIRYYNPNDFGNGSVSTITASPFFHRLMIPVAEFQQSTIATIWLVVQYIMLAIITIIGISLCSTAFSKGLVLIAGLAFLFTDAWKYHVFLGQSYILHPFFLAIITLILLKSKSNLAFLASGALAVMLVLVRPNFIIFFLPFFLLVKGVTLKKACIFALPAMLALAVIFANPFELKLWKDYLGSIKQHTKIHQGEPYDKGSGDPDPKYAEWEGLDMRKVSFLKPEMSIYPKTENGNFFVLWKLITRQKIESGSLFIINLLLIGALLSFAFIIYRRLDFETVNLKAAVIFGFCLYMITDVFSPIHRHQYYTIQWLFVIMAFFSVANYRNHFWFYNAVIAGIILNVFRVPYIKMEHTAGEYLIFAALLIFSLRFLKLPISIEK